MYFENATLPLKDHVEYVIKRSAEETAHHAEIVVGNIFDIGVMEALSRTGFHIVHDVFVVI